MKRALFCWEIGEGSGHVVPYLSLIEALRNRDWEVAVAVRNTAEVGARVQASGAMLLQAPVCLSIFPEMDASSFNTTELLLQHGYGYEATFDGMFSSWLALMRMAQPDLVIGNNAPTAHLAAQYLSLPDVAIGSGFECPIAASPAPLMRPWQAGIERRISSNEDRVRLTVNSVLLRHGYARRQFPMDMYSEVPALLCTFPELDHFGAQRAAIAEYIGPLPAASTARNVSDVSPSAGYDIFVYLRYSAAIDGLLRVLSKSGRAALIYMPNLTPAQRAKLAAEHGESLEFAAEAVDLRQVLSTVKLVISNAGHGLTLQCLLAGKPLLLLPTHWEQSLVAGMAVKIGAAIAVLPNEQHPKFHRRIDDLLQNTAYRDAAEGFAKCHQDSSRDIALEKAVHTCEARAARQDSQTKLTVVG